MTDKSWIRRIYDAGEENGLWNGKGPYSEKIFAKALRDNPPPFSWEDVEAVRNAHFDVSETGRTWYRLTIEQHKRLVGLADRIEALLSPRETPS